MRIVSHLRIRTRMLLATLLPVCMIAAVIAWMTSYQLQKSEAAELERLRTSLTIAHKDELRKVVEMARSAIEPIYRDASLAREEAQSRVRDILRSFEFDNGNYIFAWTHDSFNLAFRPKPSVEGYSKDSTPERKELLRNLVEAARNGDGFYEYDWQRPGSELLEPKISYTVPLEKWNWIIGAGIYVTDIDEAIAAARADIQAQKQAALQRMLLITAVVLAAAGLFGMFIGRTVTRPLGQVSRLMAEIADGDGDLTQRLPDNGKDELSEVGRQFNAFVVKIQNTITRVGETTEQVAAAAEELSQVAGQTRASVQQQGVETDQIAAAINEMAATVHQISMNANEVQSAASDADERAVSGGKTILSSQHAVSDLSEIIRTSAQSVENLAAKSGEIQTVLDVIRDVTDQTNLLALNAAIEAARAGEHGRGFAVVADEVRQLARRSGESAQQINGMIEGFVAETRNAVERMQNSQGQSEAAVSRINDAAGAFQTIEAAVGRIHEQITQIAAAAEEQSSVAEEVNKSVTSIVGAAAQSEAGVGQTSEASHELARLGEDLRQLVGQFRVR